MNEALDKLTTFFDSLYGAPGVLLVLVSCNALGYFLKMSVWCQNRNIPKWVVLWGISGNVLFRALPTIPAATVPGLAVWMYVQHFGRLVAIGFIIGVVSSLIYDKVLKGLESRWPWLKEFLTAPPLDEKPQLPPTPPPTAPPTRDCECHILHSP